MAEFAVPGYFNWDTIFLKKNFLPGSGNERRDLLSFPTNSLNEFRLLVQETEYRR